MIGKDSIWTASPIVVMWTVAELLITNIIDSPWWIKVIVFTNIALVYFFEVFMNYKAEKKKRLIQLKTVSIELISLSDRTRKFIPYVVKETIHENFNTLEYRNAFSKRVNTVSLIMFKYRIVSSEMNPYE